MAWPSFTAVTKESVIHKTAPAPTFRGLNDIDISNNADLDDHHGHLRDKCADKGFTGHDKRDMKRMGKTQELRRAFRPLSTLAFTVILQGTWEVLLAASTQGLGDGGLAGLFWSYVWTFFGLGLVTASLSEMASMSPTSGGQYHWVSEFSPPNHQRWLSFFTGWMSTLSWQAGSASGPFLVGTMIQSMIYVNDPSYSGTNWQGTLFVWAVTLIVYICNVYGSRAMPLFQNMLLVVHLVGFLTIVVMIWALAPRNSARVVFTQFTSSGGWSSMVLSLMIGQISAVYGLICSDAAAHISEEVKDAAVAVPRAMIYSYLLNGILGLIFLITYLFSIVDLDSALNSAIGYPFMYVFTQAFSLPAANTLCTIPIILIFAGTLSYNLSTTRQTWSFARDQGLPFSSWIARVNMRLEVPANAVATTCLITFTLSLINIGSNVAFNAIISLNLVSLMMTYMVSIACILYRRIHHPHLLLKARWSLGRWGTLINAGGLAYSSFVFFWCFWPNATPVNAEGFNWSVVMFVAVAVIAVIDWAVRGRKVYKGPVTLIEGWPG